MNSMIIYSIEIAASLALFYSVYWLFLKNDTFFRLNRFYLMASLAVSLLTPLLNIPIVIAGNSFLSEYLVQPVEEYETFISGFSKHTTRVVKESEITSAQKQPMPVNEKKDNASEPVKRDWKTTLSSAENNFSWLLIIYLAGITFFLLRFLINLTWLLGHIFKNKPQLLYGMKVIRIQKNISPFSFLNFVFLDTKEYSEAELKKIMSHEQVHIRQRHSIDLIMLELVLIFQWFNPFVWLYKRAVRITHEYLADSGALHAGVDMPDYQYSLLNLALGEKSFEITSPYNLSIKKRIAMMLKKRSSKFSVLKPAIALPVFILVFSAFAFKTQFVSHATTKAAQTKDSIKKVDVPAAYLKTLEGEYVSTNIKGRHVVFSELLGTLFAYDNGYTCKLIPVGGEKFINPDDRTPLEFNSKNKDAISLSLFGKINLNKLKVSAAEKVNKSLAFTTANVMLEKGVEAGQDYLKAAKDSAHYFATEIGFSYAGYELMQGAKLKEAVALLKMDTELYPNAYNAYDSYADALLKLGDKANAIENYKQSLKLNPGSRNGLARLKELGVKDSEIPQPAKVSVEELKPLEGVYLSTDQKNAVRKIVLTLKDGELHGEDNGYNYRLLPMGNGKFVNPDDGAYLEFNTKDKNNISFLIFGAVTMKKIKELQRPPLDYKEYAGIYLPAQKDTILRPMEIVAGSDKLFRYIAPEPDIKNRTLDLEYITDNVFYYSDGSQRSIDFIVNDKKEVTGCVLRRRDGQFILTKKK